MLDLTELLAKAVHERALYWVTVWSMGVSVDMRLVHLDGLVIRLRCIHAEAPHVHVIDASKVLALVVHIRLVGHAIDWAREGIQELVIVEEPARGTVVAIEIVRVRGSVSSGGQIIWVYAPTIVLATTEVAEAVLICHTAMTTQKLLYNMSWSHQEPVLWITNRVSPTSPKVWRETVALSQLGRWSSKEMLVYLLLLLLLLLLCFKSFFENESWRCCYAM